MTIISRKSRSPADRLASTTTLPSQGHRKSGFRPRLEALEDRLAPATLTVNDFLDRNTADAALSLREAVLLVDNGGNASAALGRNLTSGEQGQIVGVFGTGDTIRFTSSSSPRTITLTGGELLLSRGATIIGAGPSLLTVSGNHASRVFEIAAGISVKLDGLTIANGNVNLDSGGGILNSGTLSVNNCVLTGNSALDGGGIYSTSVLNLSGCTLTANAVVFEGGGILCSGIANLFNSTLDGNSADIGHHGGVGEGGGIMNFGKLTVSTCTLTNNSASNDGGGIVNWQASLTVIDSTLENNSAVGKGGGIYSLGVSVPVNGIGTSVSGSTLSHNTAFAGGGIYNTDGTLNLTDSTLNDNTASIGGAIDNSGQLSGSGDTIIASSRLTIGNSTLSGNAAAFGGGISNFGELTVSTSTLADNSASTRGGGIENSGGVATISGCTLSDNIADDDGGGLYNQGAVNLSNCTLDGNSAVEGGGLYNANIVFNDGTVLIASADISDSTFTDNSAVEGGGIFLLSGLGTVSNTTLTSNVASNLGGGIFNSEGTLNMSEDSLIANIARNGGGGGGIYNRAILSVIDSSFDRNSFSGIFNGLGGTATLDDCSLTNNDAVDGAGVVNGGTITLTNCTLADNHAFFGGGGLCNGLGTAIVSGCTVTGNTAFWGGGIFSDQGTLTVSDSTLSGNSADDRGGGIYNQGTVNLNDCTLQGNSAANGGGLYNANILFSDGTVFNVGSADVSNCTLSGNSASDQGGGLFMLDGTLSVRNTIVAGNTSPTNPDLSGAITDDLGHNLFGNTTGGSGFAASDLLNVNPLLALLGNYGGPTETMPLLPGSPAIDAGDNANAPAADQRGIARIVNDTIDIGAFESRGFTLHVLGGNNQQAQVNSSFPAGLSVAATSAFGEPVKGGKISFTPPGSGASATFPSGNTATLNLVGKGLVPVRANGIAGAYSVTAAARGASNVVFNLRNVDSTTVTLTSSFNPSNLGQSVTFTAQVKTSTVGSGSPTGTVTFFDGAATLGTATLDSTGRARFTATGFALAAGTHTITARYNGDANFLVSTSAALTQTVRSVQDQGTALMAKIDSLVSSGLLNSADGNALKAMISDAMKLFAGGSTSAGISKMNAFIVKVNDLLKASRMKEADAKFLIDAAQSIIVSAQGP